MKIDLKGIKNIIFDLGGVILNLEFEASVREFRKLGLNKSIFNGKLDYSDEIFYQFQTGQASPAEFRKRVRELLQNPEATDQQIDDAWCALLKGIPVSRIKTIEKLKEKYQIFMFSNTNKIHIDRLEQIFFEENGFSYTSAFHAVYYSQDVHDAKPAVSSYLKVIELAGVKPEETIFIDDIETNIEGARKAGLKTFWFKEGLELDEVFKDSIP